MGLFSKIRKKHLPLKLGAGRVVVGLYKNEYFVHFAKGLVGMYLFLRGNKRFLKRKIHKFLYLLREMK